MTSKKPKAAQQKRLVKTGIEGFDKLVGGGLPAGKCVLLSGTPGTGKTIFSLQYLYKGAKEHGEKGLYISFEESVSNLKSQAKAFGWDLEAMEKKGLMRLLSFPIKDLTEETAQEIIKYAKNEKVSRLVIDSLSALAINVPATQVSLTSITHLYVQRFIYGFINDLRSLPDTTTLLVSQSTDGKLSSDGVSEYVADGILHLKYETMGADYSRHLTVRKMRETKNDEDIHPVEIGREGVVIHSYED
ncbi:AAA family ATPase [Candidatus Woesearchaeota archaeon]|nr:AAA family ATPase [Candidatus Woesearchaeota archaeon]